MTDPRSSGDPMLVAILLVALLGLWMRRGQDRTAPHEVRLPSGG
jgi:hypothetical protein